MALHRPSLWIFGLFAAGTFSLNFFLPHSSGTTQAGIGILTGWRQWLNFFQLHPALLATASFSLLLVSAIGLVVTNWSRIVLILAIQQVVQERFLDLRTQFQKSKIFLSPVIQLSLLTAALIVVVSGGLFFAPFLLVNDPQSQTLLWILAVILFLPLAFTVSCLNIFTTYFIIFFKKSIGAALNLGTDFFVSKWPEILGLLIILMLIYVVFLVLGLSVVFLLGLFLKLIILSFGKFSISGFSAIIVTGLAQLVVGILLAALISILSVFYNTALLLFFLELITPIESEEKKVVQLAASPAR